MPIKRVKIEDEALWAQVLEEVEDLRTANALMAEGGRLKKKAEKAMWGMLHEAFPELRGRNPRLFHDSGEIGYFLPMQGEWECPECLDRKVSARDRVYCDVCSDYIHEDMVAMRRVPPPEDMFS